MFLLALVAHETFLLVAQWCACRCECLHVLRAALFLHSLVVASVLFFSFEARRCVLLIFFFNLRDGPR